MKCFSCSNEAIAIVNSCSPTSASGMTPPRPRCADCIVHMLPPVNLLSLLVSKEEAKEKFIQAEKRRAERIERLAEGVKK